MGKGRIFPSEGLVASELVTPLQLNCSAFEHQNDSVPVRYEFFAYVALPLLPLVHEQPLKIL